MKLLEYIFIFTVATVACNAQDELSNNSTSTASGKDVLSDNSTSTASSITSTPVSEPASSTASDTSSTPMPIAVSSTPMPVSIVSESNELMLVLNKSGKACIVAEMEMTLSIEYVNANGSTVTGNFIITNATVDSGNSSSCSSPDKDQQEELYAGFDESNTMYFLFNRISPDKVAVSMLQLNVTDLRSLFPDAMENQTMSLESSEDLFETSVNMSYKCNAETKVALKDMTRENTTNYVTFSNVQVEAFRMSADSNFSEAMDCFTDDINNIVPIAVGCALAGLVVIVLIAYLVGRRQKRQRGYESV